MASIDKRPNGRYRARWREWPGGPQRSKTFRRKVDAQDFLTGIEHALRSGTYVDPNAGRITLGDWWEQWHSTRADLRWSTETRNEIRWRLHIEPYLGDVPLAAIDRARLRTWAADLHQSGMAPSSVRKAVQAVRQVLEVAVEDRIIPTNPATRLRGLPKTSTREARFCTPEEVARLVAATDEHHRAFVATAAWSGLRLGELTGLRRRNVDLPGARLAVVETITEVSGQLVHQAFGKTSAATRTVPIPQHLVRILKPHIDGLAPEDLVFTASGGGPIRRSLFHARVWQAATIASGLGERVPAPTEGNEARTVYSGLRPHDLRHTAVSFWIAAGADLTQLKKWAGHESIATLVDTYGHLMPDREEPVLEALDALASRAS